MTDRNAALRTAPTPRSLQSQLPAPTLLQPPSVLTCHPVTTMEVRTPPAVEFFLDHEYVSQ